MRATLVNHRYLPFRGGSELYIQKFAEWLVSRHVKARVVTTNAFDLEYFWDWRARAVDAPARETIGSVEIERRQVRHPPLARWTFPVSRRFMGEASKLVPFAWPYRAVATRLPSVPRLSESISRGGMPDLVVATNLGLEGLAIWASQAVEQTGSAFILIPFAHVGDGAGSIAHRYVSMPHQRELIRRADLLIALTELEASFLEDLGARSGKIVVAGAGVEIPVENNVFADCSTDTADQQYVILSIGALARDKGTMDLVEASRLLWQRGMEHRLVLVGPEMRSFTDWFNSSGAERCSWIERRGVVEEEEKASLLSRANVLALPSRTESFGMVFLEAWSYRKPVVGARVGAVREVVSDGEDGLLVSFGDVKELAEAIERVATEPDFARSLGLAGYEKVQRHYTWEKVFERIEGAVQRVLEIELG